MALERVGTTILKSDDGTVTRVSTTYLNGLEEGSGNSTSEGSQGTSKFIGTWTRGARSSGTVEVNPVNGTSYTYTGDFADGKFHGKGLLRYSDGSTFEGTFLTGKLDGYGKMKFTNGDFYSGDFRAGNRTGTGTYTWTNEIVYEGGFLNNRIEGYGTRRLTNGDTASGVTRAGKMEGTWIVKKSDGSSFNAEYSNGEQISSSGVKSSGPDLSRRQKGIDQMTCQNYAEVRTSNQRIADGGGLGGALAQGMLISMNKQEAFDQCMKNLGW